MDDLDDLYIEGNFINVPKRWRNITEAEWNYRMDQIRFMDIWEDLCEALVDYEDPRGYVVYGVKEPFEELPRYFDQKLDEAWAIAWVKANLERLEKAEAEHNVFVAKISLELNGDIDFKSYRSLLNRELAKQKEIYDYYARR